MVTYTWVNYQLLLSSTTQVRSYILLNFGSHKGFMAYCNTLISVVGLKLLLIEKSERGNADNE